jgi:hypothetical protein
VFGFVEGQATSASLINACSTNNSWGSNVMHCSSPGWCKKAGHSYVSGTQGIHKVYERGGCGGPFMWKLFYPSVDTQVVAQGVFFLVRFDYNEHVYHVCRNSQENWEIK